ncbi:hypothetical protein ES708_01156 [subsurface metagenome]
MFGDEKAEWNKFFDFYKKKYKEEVGFVPSVFENDDYEVDLVVGEDSGKIHGIRVLQISLYEGEEGDEEEDEEDDEEDEEDEGEESETICYDFAKTKSSLSELEGKPYFDLNFKSKKKKAKKKEEDDIDLPLKIQIYSKNEDDKVIITGAVMINSDDPEDFTVLMENSELG